MTRHGLEFTSLLCSIKGFGPLLSISISSSFFFRLRSASRTVGNCDTDISFSTSQKLYRAQVIYNLCRASRSLTISVVTSGYQPGEIQVAASPEPEYARHYGGWDCGEKWVAFATNELQLVVVDMSGGQHIQLPSRA